MQKDTTISLRIDSDLKKDVEEILKKLGIPMTTAITMFFSQIKINNGLPFTPTISKPKTYEDFTKQELYRLCEDAEFQYYNKQTSSASDVEKRMKEKIKNDL